MRDPFNQFDGLNFPRTQPYEWRNIPFEGEHKISGVVLKVIGIALLWVAVFGMSMWSINESISQQPIKYARTK